MIKIISYLLNLVRSRKALIFVLLSMINVCYAAGEGGTRLPGSAAPERVPQQYAPQPSTQVETLPAVAAPPSVSQPLGAEASKIYFKLTRIVLENARIYTEKDLLPLYQSKLNKTISVAELQNIVQSITNYYRNNGYILTRAILPPQHIAGGVVRVQIVEGYVDKVAVVGHTRGAAPLIQAMGQDITASRPLKVQVLERNLLLMNEVPGVSAKSVLEPSKTETGAANVDVDAETRLFGGYVSYDNYGSRYLGPQELTAEGELYSVFRPGDMTQVLGSVTSTMRELNYVQIAHDTPLGTNGVRLSVGANYTATQPGFVLAPLNTTGLSKGAYATLKFPVIRSRGENLTITGGFNYLDSNSTSLGVQLYNDHDRSVKIGALYDFADRWSGSNLVGLDIGQGVPIFGATPTNSPSASRFGAHNDFTKINPQYIRVQPIKGPFSAMFLAKGQYSFQPLLSSEQFGFGGAQLGRGYDPSEILGDRGLAGSLEIRMDKPNFLRSQSMQFYVFYDIGAIWNINNVNQNAKDSAASAGVGVRIFMNQYLSANVMAAQPLTRVPAAEGLAGNGRKTRGYFAITSSM